jgi:ubiquinone/menaquinone biosynthesis C-methylase UbiE/DNA-binding transcriptional ArsR family regulator
MKIATEEMGRFVQRFVDQLRAAAELTRMRILAACAQGELAVSELAQILGQSQPRVSRHLKILADAGLIASMREGNWTFYRLERNTTRLPAMILDLIDRNDPIIVSDRQRLAAVRERRQAEADAYFSAHAAQWDAIRALHADPGVVERHLLAFVPSGAYGVHLDVGTGTGRILALLAPHVRESIGVDNSRAMLAIARDRAGRSDANIGLRLADMYALPLSDASVDLVTLHLVLHYAEAPEQVVAEAARVLIPGGRLLIVDFAPHDIEELRLRHAHRRLGFSDEQVQTGLTSVQTEMLPGQALTVTIWVADRHEAADMPSDLRRTAAEASI